MTIRPARDPIRPPDTDEEPWDACTDPDARPDLDRANRQRARDLALVCFGLLLALVAAAAWWSQR